MKIATGSLAPDFQLTADDGRTVRLDQFRGQSHVVVFFYPKDDTPGCTAEACSFRDQYEVFREHGAEVIGISGDSVASHQQFRGRHQLPFPILSDPGNQVRSLYGVPATLGLIPGRVTFVIDRSGRVIHTFSSQFRPGKHVAEAIKALQQADGASPS